MSNMEDIMNNRREINAGWIASHLNQKQEYALLAVHPNILIYPYLSFVISIRQTLGMDMQGNSRPLFKVIK